MPDRYPELGNLVAIDGSLIDATLSMYLAGYRKGAKKAKVHVGFDLNRSIPRKDFFTKGNGAERPFVSQILSPEETRAKKDDGICIMSSNRAEWGMADISILSIGCITSAIYPNLLGKDASYIINDMSAPFVFAEGAYQRDETLSFKDNMPQLRRIIVIDDDAGRGPLCQRS